MTNDIFISYSDWDNDVVQQLKLSLENKGMGYWLAPFNIEKDNNWAESIIKAINNSLIFVLILSEHSNTSKQVLRDVERAVGREMLIIIFEIDKVTLSKSLEYFIGDNYWYDATKQTLEKNVNEFSEILLNLIKNLKKDIKIDKSKISEINTFKKLSKITGKKYNFFARVIGVIFGLIYLIIFLVLNLFSFLEIIMSSNSIPLFVHIAFLLILIDSLLLLLFSLIPQIFDERINNLNLEKTSLYAGTILVMIIFPAILEGIYLLIGG